jgi:acetoacetyl-[acyl-carrier protein] synthase
MEVKMESFRALEYQAAGVLPTGFEPAEHYNSRFHPRGLQMAVIGASDAINSMGIAWQTVLDSVDPDEVATYACSGLGQTDENGMAGYMQARLRSERATSKQMALGLNSMPADFVNAYVCGNVGTTGSMAGACASFLYNLRLAVDDIASGRHRVVICGSSEAPVNQEVLEGFGAMSALASDDRLAKLDGSDTPDHRRASRPFAENCGFVMGESTQYFILMDDELAVELGAEIYGAVTDVFVNADGFKKSISSPGAGNYITLAKSVAAAKAVLGDEAVRERSLIQAHGSSTPQNRITESIIFDKVARAFDINDWPVTAVKAFVGHPLGPASGDQLAGTLGIFADGILPGIKTATEAASDVVDEKLDIIFADKRADIDVVFLNSKGFGGNNATATVLSPKVVESMLQKRYGDEQIKAYHERREGVRKVAKEYDELALQGDLQVIYNFGAGIINEEDLCVTVDKLTMAEFKAPVNLNLINRYMDMV